MKPEWGLKRQCLSCGAKFYDMQRDPIICPACEAPFDPEQAIRLKRNRQTLAQAEEATVKQTDDDLDVELEADIDGNDEGVLEDTRDIDDGDDVNDVVKVKKGESEDE